MLKKLVINFAFLVILFVLPLISFAQNFDFVTSQEIHTDLGPVFTLAKDFNTDGNIDLAVAHDRSPTVSILLGNGLGVFTTFKNYKVDVSNSITAGDFNEDGKIDLAIAGSSQSNISLLLGNGDGSFNIAQSIFIPGAIPGGIDFKSIKSGDFNNDGHEDLIAAGFRQYSAVILFGDGHGNFSAPQYLIASITGTSKPVRLSGLSAVEVGDFNEDGNFDVAVLNRDESSVFVFFGNGNGTFSPPVSFEAGVNPRSLSVRDINKDGHEDLIVGGSGIDRPVVLLGNGHGNFVARTSFNLGTEEWTDAIADFDQDGNLDIVAPDFFTGSVDVGAGDDSGLFTFTKSFPVGGIPRGATSGDFNNDGFPDLAIANPASGVDKISILSNNLVRKVNIDIKPDSFPNCVNLNSKGVTPVAIFGSTDFDVSDVDSSTLKFAGIRAALKRNDKPFITFEDVNNDGLQDLVAHFETDKLLLTGKETSAILTGKLFTGKAIRGTDSICFAHGSLISQLWLKFTNWLSTFVLGNYAEAANIGISIQPLKVTHTLKPGEEVSGVIEIKNASDIAVNVGTKMEDFVPLAGTYQVQIVQRAPGISTVRDWISLDARQSFTLAKDAVKDITYTIKVPLNAEPGGHFGVALFKASELSKGGQSLKVGTQVGMLILVTVPGSHLEKGKVLDFSGPRFVSKSPIEFTIKFENTGTAHFEPKGTIIIANMFGKEIGSVGVGGQAVLPTGVKDLAASVNFNGILIGRYSALLKMVDSEGNEIASRSIAFYAFPIWYVLAFFVAVAVLFFGIRFLKNNIKISFKK